MIKAFEKALLTIGWDDWNLFHTWIYHQLKET